MIGIIIGTGPSLTDSIPDILRLKEQGALLFGCNNTYKDLPLDVWLACDPAWHDHYGQVEGQFDKWHWNADICAKYGYKFIEGRWFDGLSTDKSWISYNHCSGAQLLNLAVHYGCDPILLVGHDFKYVGKRHYFDDLSEKQGEYPKELRKFSKFDGLIKTYYHIANQEGLPNIINCTPESGLPWFLQKDLADFF